MKQPILPADLRHKLHQALAQLATIVVGKNDVISLSVVCLLARGHLLLEDLPGAGKTTLAKAFSVTLGLDFRRIQFTSDLLPADVVGFSTLAAETQALQFHQGPIFTQLLLADEINRASPKSQSALLEAMEEQQVSVDHHTHALPTPFFVIATQNPLEQIGTFALPESQVDRFLMRLSLGYPAAAREVEILRGTSRSEMLAVAKPQLSRDDVLALQTAVSRVHVSESIAQYVQKLLAHTRESGDFVHGLSTRAGLALVRAAQAYALMSDESAVLPEFVQKVFPAVAWHRLRSVHADHAGHQAALARMLGQVAVPL
ncbi:MAG: AAA family ATPase [Cardiobacteriaceae bacterium]|nr:AAA family ATPase [Cardiobacteriaceae bacterium]